MTKEERKKILKDYRLIRDPRTIKRECSLPYYRRKFFRGYRYNVFIRNSQKYAKGFECVVYNNNTHKIATHYEAWDIEDAYVFTVAYINRGYIHCDNYGGKINTSWLD